MMNDRLMRAMPQLVAGIAIVTTMALGGCVLGGCDSGRLESDSGIGVPPRDSGSPPDAGDGFSDSGINIGGLSLSRVVPEHGPFTGGNEVILRGTGFDAEAQVSFGGRDVQPADHRLIDDRRLAVVVPAGDVGLVDVSVTVGDATVTLVDGYTYDAITVDPNSGSVAGGTLVSVIGSGTTFVDGDEVLFGRASCTNVEVISPTRITCRTPPMVAGIVDVTVRGTEDAREHVAVRAYTYFDSSDPLAGGLGGGPIAGSINLTVIDGMTGAPVPDAFAIVGEDLDTVHQGLTDTLGQITFSGDDLVPPVTIHVAKHCYEKTSVVAFDARDVTVFLIPWMDPMCGEGEPPPGGGRGRNGAFISGELIWFGPNEQGPNPWGNVPEAREGWVRAAYVYTTRASLGAQNPDPAAGGARQRVLESPEGVLGYPYEIFARPSGLAVYAIAGLEEQATGRFIPYIMGVARNVLAGPGQTVTGVDIVMNIPLDHFLDVQLAGLPEPARTGPDRFRVQADVDLGGEGIIHRVVHGETLDVMRRRDASRTFRFVAQPSLEGALADGRYRVQAGWYTTEFDFDPYTVAVETGITNVFETVTVEDFLGIPQPTAPASGESLPSDRILRWDADGPEPDLHMILIIGSDGNPAWRMFVPGHVREAPIPDLSRIPEIDDIPRGFVTWAIFAIAIPGFDFDEFRYTYLAERYWTRWALDVFTAQR